MSVLFERLKSIGYGILGESHQNLLRKRIYCWRLKTGYHSSEPEMDIIDHFVPEGSTVLDIGANLGKYTHALSRIVGLSGTVLAFEPIPEAYEMLSYACKKLSWSNVVIYNLALSDENSKHQMSVPLDNNGLEILGLAYLEGRKKSDMVHTTYFVETRCLDDMGLDLKKLDFIKCDVEGAELKVFKGAERTIRKFKPIIMAEIEDRHLIKHGLTASDVVRHLSWVGYESYYCDGDRMISCTEVNDKNCNYFFIPQERKPVLESFRAIR